MEKRHPRHVEEYFEILGKIDPSPEMKKIIIGAREDLSHRGEMILSPEGKPAIGIIRLDEIGLKAWETFTGERLTLKQRIAYFARKSMRYAKRIFQKHTKTEGEAR